MTTLRPRRPARPPRLCRLARLNSALLGAVLCAAFATPALAQPAAGGKPAASAAKAPPKPAARPAAKAPPPPPPLPEADEDQLKAAERTFLGDYECEFKEVVQVARHPRSAGYVDVRHRKNVWTMKPVLSFTGALRLEDVKGRMLMLQIANKSMLMDAKIGQRVADNCVTEGHREAMAAHKAAGGGDSSIGIDPARAAAASTPASGPTAAQATSAAASGAAPGATAASAPR